MSGRRRWAPVFALLVALTGQTAVTALPAMSAPVQVVATATTEVSDLRVNALEEPLGIEVTAPDLSWKLTSGRRAVTQQAYQVRVASSTERLGSPDVWDSGRVESGRSVDVRYGGPTLRPRSDYFWSVRVWDDQGVASEWSEPARFGTGLGDQPWRASWIGADTDRIEPEWTDYTIALTASEISGALGVYFRGDGGGNGYMWQISDADNALRPHVKRNGGYSVLAPKAFPAGFDFAAEHDYEITVDGSSITTEVDGVVLDQRTDASFAGPGIVGFRTSGAESGLVHDITVTADDGTVLVDTLFPAGDRTFVTGTVTPDGLRVDSSGGEAWLRRDEAVPLLRKEFDLGDKEVDRARVYASARGVYELRLNGDRVGDNELAPGWTAYDKRIDYQVYDVTDQVAAGANVLGAEVAPGWYTGKVAMFGTDVYGTENSVIAELVVEFTDGTSTVVVTDDTWRTTDGPTRAADLLDGEEYDARVAADVADWDEPGFDDSGWNPVVVSNEPTDVLEAQTSVPVRVTEELDTTTQINSPTDGVYLYDLGQNMVGHLRLTLQGEPGQTVMIRHGEVLNPDGTLYTANLRSAKATDYYTFATDEPETYEPSYTFHGFRYVEISGIDEAPDAADITGVVVGTDGELTSTLDTSSELVDQLHRNIVWGMRGNFLSIPTDTPARDERMGWTGDINVFSRTAVYNMDAQSFLTKWLQDLRDTQRPNGALPGVVPIVPDRFDGGYESAGWMDAGVHVPWTLWQAYGDTGVIRDNYAMMRRYVDFLAADSNGHIRSAGGYLDWLNLEDPTPAEVIDTAFVAKSTRELAQMAEAIGRDGEAAELMDRYRAIRTAYQAAFIAADGTVRGDSQTAYILTLTNDLEPADRREAVVEQFVQTLERRDYHLSTGFLGVDGLLPALTDAGRTDIAYRLLQHEDYPSWGYEIGLGATTVWERWNSINPDGTFNNVGMNSFNHYAYGAVGEWMYRTMAGVSAAEPGYRKVLVAPVPGAGIDHVDFSVETPYGKVRSAWSTADGPLTLDVTVPANTTAEVRVPAESAWAVTEGGRPASEVDGIEVVGYEDGAAVLEVGSGDYLFAVDPVLGELGDAREAAGELAAVAAGLDAPGAPAVRMWTRQIATSTGAARTAYIAGDTDAAAVAVHRALARLGDVARWTAGQVDAGNLDAATGDHVQSLVGLIDARLSSASGSLLGAAVTVELPPQEWYPGSTVPLTVVVENSGSGKLDELAVDLAAPDGWAVAPDGDLPTSVDPGQTVRLDFEVMVPATADPGSGRITGTATYRFRGGPATVPVGATVLVAAPVVVDEVAVSPTPVGPGDAVAVAVDLSNRADRAVTGEVRLEMPSGWTAPAAASYALEQGASTTVNLSVRVPQTVVGDAFTVTASVGATDVERGTGAGRVRITAPPAGPTDHIDLGNGSSESAHHLTASEHSGTNIEAGLSRRYTHAQFPGGWFEVDLAVPRTGPFVVVVVETFDGARRKTYDVLADGRVVHSVDVTRTAGGQGSLVHQFVVESSAATADGAVRLRFQDTGADYDPSVADLWAVPVR